MKSKEFLEMLKKDDSFDYGILPPPTSAQKGLNILIRHFLGEDWYSVNPISAQQVNTEAICEILDRYPQKKPWWKC